VGSTLVSVTVSEGDLTKTCQGSVDVLDCEPPTVTCPPPATIECDPPSGPDQPPDGCTHYVPAPASAVDTCGPTTVPPIEECVHLGTSSVQEIALDPVGNVGSCWSQVTVVDTHPPVVTPAPGPARELGFTDDQMHTVSLADCGVQISDQCMSDVATRGTKITCVTSDEEEGPTPDVVIVDADARLVQLRASRDAAGDGRVYSIHFTATDGGGNSTPGTCQFTVPRLRHHPAVDSGPRQRVCSSWCGRRGGLPCEYRAVRVPQPPEGAVAYAVNGRGQIVGSAFGAGYGSRGVMWQNGAIVELGDLGGDQGCVPSAINEQGHVTGYGFTADGRTAPFLWADGVIRELAGIPEGQAFAINDRDQIVGTMYDGEVTRGFLFDHGQVTPIGSPSGTTVAAGINNVGQVVGGFDNHGSGAAFLWDHGVLHPLPDPIGLGAGASAINDAGLIVGSRFDGTVDNAVMWNHGRIVDLGVSRLWGAPVNSFAVAINNRGEIVGSTSPPDGHPHVFHYEQGTLTNLDSTTRKNDLPFNEAHGINDDGLIVGAGFADADFVSHALLWVKR
jgi:probable HAF family extracellular repeat protein